MYSVELCEQFFTFIDDKNRDAKTVALGAELLDPMFRYLPALLIERRGHVNSRPTR